MNCATIEYMKLITLNTWAGRLKEPFEQFLHDHKDETDIFCFQEIFNKSDDGEESKPGEINTNIFSEISSILTDFDAHFCPVAEDVYGIAIFLKKGLEVVRSGEVLIYQSPTDEQGDHDRKMQWIHIKKDRKDVLIMNTHGHWDPSGKGDTPKRLEQSKAITDFIQSIPYVPKILVGDMNLDLKTESIKLLEEYFINLIDKHDIQTTRTEFYTGEGRHADYVFVSSEVLIEQFKVLPDVVSDHAPLFIQFDVF